MLTLESRDRGSLGRTSVSLKQRLQVEIHGAVQGVGFRPFVYRLATDLALAGWVINDTRGVFIEVEGPQADLARFLERVPFEKPPRAIIHSLDTAWLDPVGYEGFEIRHSEDHGAKTVLVLPDIATCADCLAEVFDPGDRRYRYPFTNCTNCGPRFTIIQALPYDRPNTTMHRFVMCPDCQAEYESPLDRRFHAQPNACPVCGPRLALYARPPMDDEAPRRRDEGHRGDEGRSPAQAGRKMEDELGPLAEGHSPFVVGPWSLVVEGDDALRRTANALRAGQIVAVKGLGGFHLMTDARDAAAITRLRERKPRRDKPFALMARDLDQARALCEISPQAGALLTSPEAPIVLLRRRPGAPVAEEVAPGNPTLGVMLPYTPLHHLLLRELDFPVVATSGNLTDEPICTDEGEAIQRLGHIADLFLVHDRPIARHVDDSVTWVVQGEPRLLRRARGYAPLPVLVSRPLPTILAVGAHLKNTVALSVDRQVFISQHIGDLETPEAMAAFERVIADFLRLYEATPVAIAHDMHPDYLSTRWAQEQGLEIGDRRLPALAGRPGEIRKRSISNLRSPISSSQSPVPNPQSPILLIPVQHHHAHLAACLAENGVEQPALGVTWDGTGYGTDGSVWGGEFLLGDAADFTRVAHLRPFRLPGGDAAIKEPRRVALALLWELYGESVLDREDLAPVRALRPPERRLLAQMLSRGLNAPLTTSAGRLFDAVAALVGLHQQVTFEGQAAMALEFAADVGVEDAYPMAIETAKPRAGGTKDEAPRRRDERRSPAQAGRRTEADNGRQSSVLSPSSLVLDWQPLVEAVLEDLQQGVKPGIIAGRFHNALADAILAVAQAVGEPRVALTGGCFQNRLLTERAARRLNDAGFQVLLQRQVPPNDGGISLGQVVVAAARLEREM
jgi:hydrogenase maturation protein HypF